MKKIIIIVLILIPVCEVFSQNKNLVPAQERSSSVPKLSESDILTYSIFSIVPSQYGYDIFQNNKLLIHQPQIPGISGNKGFETSEDATKVATLVVDKIKKGIFPPTVTLEELKNLNIKIE